MSYSLDACLTWRATGVDASGGAVSQAPSNTRPRLSGITECTWTPMCVVKQVAIDYHHNNGEDRMLKIITFDPQKNKVYFQTCSIAQLLSKWNREQVYFWLRIGFKRVTLGVVMNSTWDVPNPFCGSLKYRQFLFTSSISSRKKASSKSLLLLFICIKCQKVSVGGTIRNRILEIAPK